MVIVSVKKRFFTSIPVGRGEVNNKTLRLFLFSVCTWKQYLSSGLNHEAFRWSSLMTSVKIEASEWIFNLVATCDIISRTECSYLVLTKILTCISSWQSFRHEIFYSLSYTGLWRKWSQYLLMYRFKLQATSHALENPVQSYWKGFEMSKKCDIRNTEKPT